MFGSGEIRNEHGPDREQRGEIIGRSQRSTILASSLALILAAATLGLSAEAVSALPPGGTFTDDNGNPHEGSIEAIHAAGITQGCSADGRLFCPLRAVTRAEMTAFIARALGIPPASDYHGYFPDVAGVAWYAPYAERLYEIGAVAGYEDGSFRPETTVSRAEMAAMIVRAFDHLDVSTVAGSFSDVPSNVWFAAYVEGLLGGGVTTGCAISPLRFCPQSPVLRDQMATFLARAVGLDPIVPPSVLSGTALAELHVDGAASNASDGNPGTVDAPLATIQAAVDRSKQLRQNGQSVRIVVHPGVYRESVTIGHAGSNPPSLVLEAAQPGAAIVAGSDVWNGWTYDGSIDASVHFWPYDWGQASGVAPIVGRREMVFVNGLRLAQVMSLSQLSSNAFYVDESGDRIFVRTNTRPLTSAEVAVRPRTITIDGAEATTVRGFVFKHAASPFDESSVEMVNGGNNTFDANTVTQNSWGGVGTATASNLAFSKNVINSNGGGGMSIFKVPGLLLESNTTSYNNWRGVQGGYTGWSIAAVKMVGTHNAVIRSHRSIGNATRGFWVDYDIRNVAISGSTFSDNLSDGLFIEAVPGPVTVTSTDMSRNGRYGLLVSNVLATSIVGSRMCTNGTSAIRIDSDPGGRTVESTAGTVWIPAAKDLELQGNTFGGSERLMDSNVPSDHWSTFIDTLSSDGNTWIPIDPATAFVFQSLKRDLAAWQSATGQDPTSTIASAGC